MRINWVLSEYVQLDPLVDIDAMKDLGSFWGSWRTWRAYQTDNVVCHDQRRANEFLQRNFQANCNFYIPNSVYTSLNRPAGVNLYEGTFKDDTVQSEDIVAVHLVSGVSDIVLLMGFDFSPRERHPDRLVQHQRTVYARMIRKVMEDNPTVQWVLVDHSPELSDEFEGLTNLTTDTLAAVLELGELDH